jgi:MFS superfamily sulfate permease-like transporter
MSHPWRSNIRNDVVGGLVSAAVAIPLAMGFGMFAFVSLGDKYFANGALAGLYSAFVVAIVCVLLGDKSPTVYARGSTAHSSWARFSTGWCTLKRLRCRAPAFPRSWPSSS